MSNIKKNENKKSFILSAIEIIENLGIGKLSARNIATRAGYKPGSIYNYFDNLDHLESVASIHFTEEYVNELASKTRDVKSGIRSYIIMWEIFLLYGFQQPEIFYNVFYSAFNQGKKYNLFEEYYEIFPEELPIGGYIEGMFHISTAQQRGYYVLKKCVEEGTVESDKIEYINEMNLGYSKTVFIDILEGNLEISPKLFHKTIIYIIYSIYYYIDSSFHAEIDSFIKFHIDNNEEYLTFYSLNKFENSET